jgi:hypothetical protein
MWVVLLHLGAFSITHLADLLSFLYRMTRQYTCAVTTNNIKLRTEASVHTLLNKHKCGIFAGSDFDLYHFLPNFLICRYWRRYDDYDYTQYKLKLIRLYSVYSISEMVVSPLLMANSKIFLQTLICTHI